MRQNRSMRKSGIRGYQAGDAISQMMQRAAMAYAGGEWAEAERCCRQILATRSKFFHALNLLGIIAAQTRRPDEAVSLLGRAIAANPGDATAHNNYANVLRDLKRFDEALASYDRALKLKPDYAEAYKNRGNTLSELKRFEEALDSYDHALRFTPDDAEVHNSRGNTLWELERFLEALDSCDRALKLKSDFAEAHNNRGNSLRALKRPEDALASYDRALKLRADYAEVHNNRGNALRELKRFEDALGSYRKALDCDPGLLRVYQQLAELLGKMGRTDEAAAVYLSWLEAEPTNPSARHMYAAASGRNVPERCDSRYVTALFDELALSFDATLERLEYAAPRLLSAALAARVPFGQGNLDVLDAGCGTGLCGPLLRSTARVLAGVDLSSEMLARARARNVYDELVQAELCEFMESRPHRFDIVNCADTLIYVGALEPVMAATHRCLRPKGVFAFTVEALPEGILSPFRLTMTGRYAHSDRYVREVMASAGFSEPECRTIDLRKEAGVSVRGFLFIGSVAA